MTTVTATSTVPAPAGFVPVQDSLPGAGDSGRGGANPVRRRDVSTGEEGMSLDPRAASKNSSPARGFPQFVKRVDCHK